MFAEKLSTLPFNDVMAVLAEMANAPSDYEPAIPRFGDILQRVQDRSHPLRHFRELIRKMAAAFDVKPTPVLLETFEQICGHRTDEDMDAAYRTIMRSEAKRMPTPGQFLQACPTLKVDRNGKKY